MNSLQFPSEQEILTYLESHPQAGKITTHYPFKNEILEIMARAFADSKKAPQEIKRTVLLKINDLDKIMNLPEQLLLTISLNLGQALIDCAQGKKIEIEKR